MHRVGPHRNYQGYGFLMVTYGYPLHQVEKDDEKIGSLKLLKGHEVACLSWSLASLPNSLQFQALRHAVQRHVLEEGSHGDQRGLAMLARSLVKLQLKEAFLHLADQVQHQVQHQDLAPAAWILDGPRSSWDSYPVNYMST